MQIEKAALFDFMKNPEKIDDESFTKLNETIKAYPYFQTVQLLRLKKLYASQHADFQDELTKTAIFCADRKKLYYWIKGEQYADFFGHKNQPDEEKDRTKKLLDSFLNNLSEESEIQTPQPTTAPDNGVKNMVSYDYLSYLQLQENENTVTQNEPDLESDKKQLNHHNIIDRFIENASSNSVFSSFSENQKESAVLSPLESDKQHDSSEFLTETLARIYIKQRKYEQALTIIKRLSLNFPKKSIYFADQIRFLELLILNEKNKKQP